MPSFMRVLSKTRLKVIFLFIVLSLIGFHCKSQNCPSVSIVTGFGLPESFHLGFKIHAFKKNLFGLYYGNGLNFSSEYHYNSLTFDHQYHFDKITDLNQWPRWFFRQGLSYSKDNSEYSEIKYLFLNLSIGREFNISPKIGLSADLGFFHTIMEKESIINPNKSPWIDIDLKNFFVLPIIRMQVHFLL